MYSEKFVVAVKHNGRVLREQGDTVFLPFGCEYSLHFKNLNTVRALVRVSIDGQDATKDTSLIVPANGSIDLERFLDVSEMGKGHRFKFIERTKKVEDGPRGIGAEDGLIRVEFEFERLPAPVVIPTYPTYPSHPTWTVWTSTTYSATDASTLRSTSLHPGVTCSDVGITTCSDVGITVPGSVSDQRFVVGAWFPTDGQKHVLVLRLQGQVGETKVEKPVTVKTKQECPTCGTKNKFGTKFCRECGTGLTLLETVT